MSQVISTRGLRWLVIGSLAALTMVVSVAVGMADPNPPPDQITLTLESGTNEFQWGDTYQYIAPGRNECSVNPDTNDAGLVTVTHSTFNKQGKAVDGHLGLVEDGMGVNEKGNGNGQDCGRVDRLDNLGPNKTESLTFEVGPTVTSAEQIFAWIDFDLEAKYDAEVRFDFYLGGQEGTAVGGPQYAVLNEGSDSGPDSKFRDKYKIYAYPGAPNYDPSQEQQPPSDDAIRPFDTVVVTMVTGGVSIEGGATWDQSPTEEADDHRTVFHLASMRTEISIDAVANDDTSDDLGYIAAGTQLDWTYVVTNTGDVPLEDVEVEDSTGLTITPDADYEGEVLSPGEAWTYTASGPAIESGIDDVTTHTATATGTSESRTDDATDTVVYFGANPELDVDVTSNGVGTPPVVSGDSIIWKITVTNVGNVPIDVILAEEDLPPDTDPNECVIGSLQPGDPEDEGVQGVCFITIPVLPGAQSSSFTVTGLDPEGNPISPVVVPVEFFGGLDCGQGTIGGEPGLNDTPLAGFYVGPLTKDSTCAVPVEIVTTNNPEDPSQTVFLGPPDGYEWIGVTGLLTVKWDIENPVSVGVRPTFQGTGDDIVEVPDCAGPLAVAIDDPVGGDDFFYTLTPDGEDEYGQPTYPAYPNATGGGTGEGDVCLVRHITDTVNYTPPGGSQTVKTVTTEVFYIYNDPTLSRPR